ncbi:drug/metabolite exporter YedA [Gemmatimonas groenlandica]|uniref:Drug/metabolite exporter YedA n=1 Tax=Gemmatimonas groenlandica TaxID=2732249 RepID=A0A6M4IPZ1_9BACT|nr:drug/metabolite exporter YedA [Gemmatimonas groenlandica]QJR36994.1 drug/metabolite exporter YedA [Gemmatimonas groenlandica]
MSSTNRPIPSSPPPPTAQPVAATKWQLVVGFLIIYVVWGSTYLAIHWGVETIPPFGMGAVRFLTAGSMLYSWCRFRGAKKPTSSQWKASAVIGTMLLFVGNGAVSWASQRVPSGLTSVLVATVPLWLVLCELWQGKRPDLIKVIGVLIGLAGVALLVMPTGTATATVDPVGAVVLALGSLSWTIGSLYSRTARQSESPALAIAMQMLVGGSLLLTLSLAVGEWTPDLHVTVRSAASLLYLIVFGSLIGFSTYMWLLKVASPTAVGTYAYVNPAVAVLLGVLLAGERLPAQAVAAMTVILGGVAMVSIAGGGAKRMVTAAWRTRDRSSDGSRDGTRDGTR